MIGSCTDLNVDSGSCSGSNLKYWLRLLLQPEMQTPAGVHSSTLTPWSSLVWINSGRSHFFRLWLRSCSKILESGSRSGFGKKRESDSCSDSGYNHQSNLNLPMFLLNKLLHRPLLLPKLKSDSGSGSGFSQSFWLRAQIRVRKKRRIRPESTPVTRIRSHIWSGLLYISVEHYPVSGSRSNRILQFITGLDWISKISLPNRIWISKQRWSLQSNAKSEDFPDINRFG